MKNTLALFVLLMGSMLVVKTSSAQLIAGSWSGELDVQGQKLKIVFHVKESNGAYSASMDSPDQGALGIPASDAQYINGVLTIKIAAAGIEYTGEHKLDRVVGHFKQGAANLPLDLARLPEEENNNRPQTPIPPFPYLSEDVSFTNHNANITLSGTLTVPKGKGKFPVVVLISGSGPQNRDEELMGHKPFLVIADYLSRNGIAVLRYDDRGVAKSQGNFQSATSADFAGDAKAAVEYLLTREEIDHAAIGLMGHSEGGMIAPMVAAESSDVAFIILLAGTGIRGDQLLLKQQELIATASGVSKEDMLKSIETNKKAFELVMNAKDDAKMLSDLRALLQEATKDVQESDIPTGMTKEKYLDSQVAQLTSPWMKFFLSYDPVSSLKNVKCPVFAVNGAMDLQVPADINLLAIETALKEGGNNHVITKKYPAMNHLFQVCTTGSPDEYPMIRETFSPDVLSDIQSWILSDK